MKNRKLNTKLVRSEILKLLIVLFVSNYEIIVNFK